MAIKNVCVMGGSGFVGSQLVCRLAATGMNVLVPTRHPERHRDLLVLPNVQLVEADIHDPDTLDILLTGQDAAINLVGILNEYKNNNNFQHVHVDLAKTIITACQKNGISRYLHMSALHADQTAGQSVYLRSKGEAEHLIHTFSGNELKITSFRPSVIFGPDDKFINLFAKMINLSPGILPLACPNARFAPVYIGDVVDSMVHAINDAKSFSKRINLCGPNTYSLKEIVQFIAATLNKSCFILGLPNSLAKLQAKLLQYAPGKPFTMDNYHSLQTPSVCPEGGTCSTSMETIVPTYIGRNNQQNHFDGFRRRAKR